MKHEVIWQNPAVPNASPTLRDGMTWESRDMAQLSAVLRLINGSVSVARYRTFTVEALEERPELKVKKRG